jgi:hypothetical protein
MPFEDPWLKKGQPSPIEFERVQYQKSEDRRNPIHVLRAYQICRELMARPGLCDTLPDWIFQYFDTIAEAVQTEFHEDKPAPAKILEAMKIKAAGQGVRTSAFSAHALARRDISLAIEVRKALRQNPERSIWETCAAVATALAEGTLTLSMPCPPVGEDTVAKAFDEWREFLEDQHRLVV